MDNTKESLNGKTMSMDDVLRNQQELEEEAAEAIPYNFNACTFGNESFKEAKQSLFSCLTCRPQPLDSKDRAGICAGCSVSCHGDCELVELFTRRDFVCDCGTSRLPGKKCSLTLRQDDVPNDGNRYDANFDGIFCSCQTRYDPETETDEMIQCLVCEDWYHTSKCLASGSPSKLDTLSLHSDAFDTFVCEKCVEEKASQTIARYAGTPRFMLLFPDGSLTSNILAGQRDKMDLAKLKGQEEDVKEDKSPDDTPSPPAPEVSSRPAKRTFPPENEQEPGAGTDGQDDNRPAKLQKTEDMPEDSNVCRAPPEVNAAFESVTLRRKDVYLEEGWRERLCRCEKCMPLYTGMPYLHHEEEIFEPPEDNDAHKSLFDLGTEALLQMPREQAVQGLEAYASMRDGLRAYLEPFAREGKVVQESDIQEFFRAEKEKMAALARGQQLS